MVVCISSALDNAGITKEKQKVVPNWDPLLKKVKTMMVRDRPFSLPTRSSRANAN